MERVDRVWEIIGIILLQRKDDEPTTERNEEKSKNLSISRGLRLR